MAKRKEYRPGPSSDRLPVRVEDAMGPIGGDMASASMEDVETMVQDLWQRQAQLKSQLRLEEESRGAHELLARMAPVALALVDGEGKVEFVNHRFTATFGYTLEDIPTLDAWRQKVFPDADYRSEVGAGMDRTFRETLQNQPEFQTPELRVTGKDGTERVVIISISRIGRRYAVVFDDVTERNQAERALRASEDKFAKAFRISPVPIIISTLKEGRFIDVNQSYLDECGYRREELIGHLTSEFNFWQGSRREEIVRRICAAGSVRNIESAFVSKDGKTHRVLFSADRIVLDGEECLISIANDITDYHSTQAALRESEEFCRHLFEDSPNPILVIDADNAVKYVNPAFEQLTGFGLSDIAGHKPPFPYWPPEKSKQYLEDYHNPGICKTEMEIRTKSGDRLWVQLNSTPVWDAEDKPKYHVCTWTDMTLHKQMEQALRLSEEKFSRAFNACPVPMSIATLDEGRFVEVNQAFLDNGGFKREEVIGRTPEELKGWPTIEQWDQLVKTITETGRIRNSEIVMHNEFGETKASLFSAERITVGDKHYLLAISNDITERKKAEQALKETSEFNSALLENSPHPIIVTNPDASISYVNPSFENLTGFTRNESVGLKPPFPWWPESEHARFMEENVSGRLKTLNKVERCYRKKNGEPFWIASKIKPISATGDAKCFIANWSDITERKKSEEALRNSEAHFRLIMARSPVPMIVNEENGRIEYVNESFTATFGYTVDDFPDTDSWWRKVYPEEKYCEYVRANHRKAVEKALMENRQTDPQEYTLTCKDGSRRVAQVSGSSIANKRVVVFNDMTARRRAEEKTQQTLVALQSALEGCIRAAAKMVELRDPYTAGHQQRVARLVKAIAAELQLPGEQIEYLTMAASVHDIGKIYVPAEILNRTGKLTAPEYAMIQGHVQGGYSILSTIQFPWPIADIVWQHHERLDGSGYPRGLKGEEILLDARILGVADTVEAMSAHRPYRPALGRQEAVHEITQNSGTAFDAGVVSACVRVLERDGWPLMDGE